METYLNPWKKFVDFSGRASRKEYWTFTLVNVGIYIVLSVIGAAMSGPGSSGTGAADLLPGLFSLVVLLPGLAVGARRLHDTGRSGWWMLLYLAYCIGGLILLFFFLQEGDIGENEYGLDPYGDDYSSLLNSTPPPPDSYPVLDDLQTGPRPDTGGFISIFPTGTKYHRDLQDNSQIPPHMDSLHFGDGLTPEQAAQLAPLSKLSKEERQQFLEKYSEFLAHKNVTHQQQERPIIDSESADRQSDPVSATPAVAKGQPEILDYAASEKTLQPTKRYLESPRQQHYYFAHVYLRDKALGVGATAVEEYWHPKATEHLKIAWVTLGAMHKDRNDAFIPADGVEAHPFTIGTTHKGVIIEFPEPKGPAEAFMTAIVVPADAKPGEKCRVRYFTLELSPPRPHHTTMCEWSDFGHMNLAVDDPPPNIEAFKQAVIGLVIKK